MPLVAKLNFIFLSSCLCKSSFLSAVGSHLSNIQHATCMLITKSSLCLKKQKAFLSVTLFLRIDLVSQPLSTIPAT